MFECLRFVRCMFIRPKRLQNDGNKSTNFCNVYTVLKRSINLMKVRVSYVARHHKGSYSMCLSTQKKIKIEADNMIMKV